VNISDTELTALCFQVVAEKMGFEVAKVTYQEYGRDDLMGFFEEFIEWLQK